MQYGERGDLSLGSKYACRIASKAKAQVAHAPRTASVVT